MTARGRWSRSSSFRASSPPTLSWPRNGPSSIVDGLPMSWRSAAHRTTGSPPGDGIHGSEACGRAGPRPRSCSGERRAGPRSPAGGRRGGPRPPAAEGRPTAAASRGACPARPRRAPRRRALREAAFSRIAASVGGSIEKSRTAARRTARTIRRASSRKRVRGLADRTDDPPLDVGHPRNGSTMAALGAPSTGAVPSPRGAPEPQAIAFTVKSRRARSSSTSSPNSTRCGRRKSA